MTCYVVPPTGDLSKLSEFAARVKMEVLQVKTVREFVLTVEANPISVIVAPAQVISLLARHSGELLTEMPFCLISVPGLLYSSEWTAAAATLPPENWSQFEGKWSRSGLTQLTPESSKQTRGIVTSEIALLPTDDIVAREVDAISKTPTTTSSRFASALGNKRPRDPYNPVPEDSDDDLLPSSD